MRTSTLSRATYIRSDRSFVVSPFMIQLNLGTVCAGLVQYVALAWLQNDLAVSGCSKCRQTQRWRGLSVLAQGRTQEQATAWSVPLFNPSSTARWTLPHATRSLCASSQACDASKRLCSLQNPQRAPPHPVSHGRVSLPSPPEGRDYRHWRAWSEVRPIAALANGCLSRAWTGGE
ncbi:hypothetical protein EDB86DRAFT_2948861 [Lactarius hatsudake]|nr:hypothetical protein EDB86DRAFT_2948861 [Lactarius hatsudake]